MIIEKSSPVTSILSPAKGETDDKNARLDLTAGGRTGSPLLFRRGEGEGEESALPPNE